jgi:hypothetical protein
MPISDPRALKIKANAVADETDKLARVTTTSQQATVSDQSLWIGATSQAESDAVASIASARLTAQTSLVAALNAL